MRGGYRLCNIRGKPDPSSRCHLLAQSNLRYPRTPWLEQADEVTWK